MLALAGGDLVLSDRILPGGLLTIADGRIVAIEPGGTDHPRGLEVIDISDTYVVPGFIDVHVHGVEGYDTLDGGEPVAEIARRLPRYGVTAFCPTTVACTPDDLRRVLRQVSGARAGTSTGARVLPAHLESNFVNPDYAGAQPIACLRMPRHTHGSRGDGFSGAEILDVIASSRGDVGIVTLAPELPGGVELVRHLASAGHRVSLGHSAADFETASEAIDAGARHATHLFNRMTPLGHRAPGLAGAVLSREEVAAEIICDGFHVHPAMARMAIAAKGPRGIMAITDGTAGSGLPPGSGVHLGGRPITVREKAAFLEDGTLAGSTVTMDRVFGTIVRQFGRSVVDAACMCATTPANALALADAGALAHGMRADLVVMTRNFEVEWTFVNGEAIYHRSSVRAPGRRT